MLYRIIVFPTYFADSGYDSQTDLLVAFCVSVFVLFFKVS